MLYPLTLPLNPLLNLTARPATAADAVIMATLFNSSRSHFYQLGLPSAAVDLLLQQQYQLQQTSYYTHFPQACDYVFSHQGQVIGKLTLDMNSQAMHIVDLIFFPEHRGQGFGSGVLTALKQVAMAQPVPINLSVDSQNIRAKTLYLKHGFFTVSATASHEVMQWFE